MFTSDRGLGCGGLATSRCAAMHLKLDPRGGHKKRKRRRASYDSDPPDLAPYSMIIPFDKREEQSSRLPWNVVDANSSSSGDNGAG